VIDDGSPDVLRNRPGLYRDLLAKQHGRHHAPDGTAPTGERVA
jgi:ATP-binding cassette subfamily B protein